ncbi:chromosome segregation protein SMC [Candidatus Pacearchaeota archaeon]|nr:chromosome segregation protein SMC [Candidatus Pacearchaeota archaeon]
MTYIKKMTMHGFKSFARKTELPFDNSMNVIVGPNGSGKSNITDALCFVLGRLSIKSIRAARAANLLFSGNQTYKGSLEASVELTFDNTDKSFAIDSKEVVIKRAVRKSGQSIYKINDKIKNRQEILELLSQAGVDPNGFNIVLQGEIQSLVQATSEERRKIIEEVAGISIYEARKIKSIRELEKTEEKLHEVSTVLKERTAYLKNLDKERQEAISYQKLEETIKRCKKTLLVKNKKGKEENIVEIKKSIQDIDNEIEKIKKSIQEKNFRVEEFQNKILAVNKQIQSSTSNEQEVLHREISDLKAELAGLDVRRENFENRLTQGKKKTEDLKEKIENLGLEMSRIQTSSPEIKKQQEQQKILTQKFEILEQQRRKFYISKSELSTLENQKLQKEKFLIESKKEVQLIEQTITALFNEIKYEKALGPNENLKFETGAKIEKTTDQIFALEREILEKEKRNAILEMDVKREEKLKSDIIALKSCPICKQEVSEDHKHKISTNANEKIESASKEVKTNLKIKIEEAARVTHLKEKLSDLRTKLEEIRIDRIKLKNSDEKKERIKILTEKQEEVYEEIKYLNEKIHAQRAIYEKLTDIEEKYDETRLALQENSFIDMDVDTEVQIKKREIGRLTLDLRATGRDIEESQIELRKIELRITEKDKEAVKKEIEEQKLYEKSQKFFDLRNELQDQQKVIETDIIGLQHTVKNFEDKINYNKIQKAQLDAQIESLNSELAEFTSLETLPLSTEQLKERLQKAQFGISRLGNVNMRALEVFDKVEEQVKIIEEKVKVIQEEKEQIDKIIQEIDKKKKKSFLSTLSAVNEYFTRNFTQLSRKGEVTLELENKQNPFEGGLSILVKVSHGKHFDITSLSGGEKTMVALSLIFAIQEYKPYCFYVFDEIDAALDKHNSELLSALIKKYMTTGQYIVITHNDTLISEASNLYGVSMQENISKIISLKV